MALILASKSRSRKIVLELFGFDFSVEPAGVDEKSVQLESPEELTKKIAEMKAKAIAEIHPQDTVIGIDTMVYKERELIGQPDSEENAREIMQSLLGKWHDVYSGYCIICNGNVFSGNEMSRLKLKSIEESVFEEYISSGSWEGKAGGYNIADPTFENFVEKVEGSKLNIVGLPAEKILPLIESTSKQKAVNSIEKVEAELFRGTL